MSSSQSLFPNVGATFINQDLLLVRILDKLNQLTKTCSLLASSSKTCATNQCNDVSEMKSTYVDVVEQYNSKLISSTTYTSTMVSIDNGLAMVGSEIDLCFNY